MLGKSSTSADKAPAVREGDVIHGKYRVERIIGEGGMGVVVAARHLTLDKQVALKLLSPKSGDSAEALERFTREARAAARIQSEHVGRVQDVDTLPSGAPFIVMELLEGHDLAVELRKGPPPLERAVNIVLQACEAVAEAHASGIVHRDLKPANLFLAKKDDGTIVVKVLDFGISKITRHEPSAEITEEKALTNANTMLGSPLYMSPEQMKASGDVDARTDIWSIGVILYEMLTAVSPFDAATIPMICANVLSMPPPKLEMANAPEGLERILLRCLEKDPKNRYRDVAHLVRSLAPFAPEQAKITLDRIGKLRGLDGQPAASPPSLMPPPHREGAATVTSWNTKSVATGWLGGSKRRWIPIALAGGVCAVILVAVALQSGPGSDDQAAAATHVASTALPEPPQPQPPTVKDPEPAQTAAASASVATTAAASASAPPHASASAPGNRPQGKWPPQPKPKNTGYGGRE
ncbi:MAG: serine/threonine protein kinase [Polyangiaceae bacterium]|nr:serine/threonine protein kinase [Polyangiaceae bacterium]